SITDFCNRNVLGGKLISDEVLQYSWNVAVSASPWGTLECVDSWLTDFRRDVSEFDMPCLVIHGDADRILPLDSTGRPLSESLENSRFIVIKGAPHGLLWTHGDQVSEALIDFIS